MGRGSQILHKSQTQHMVTVEKEREVKDVTQVLSLETEKNRVIIHLKDEQITVEITGLQWR